QHEAGRTEATLKTARLDEGLLHVAEALRRAEMLDGDNLAAVHEGGEEQAGGHGAPVDQHGAAPAQALAAAFARPEQAELLLQHLDEVVMRGDLRADRPADEREADRPGRRAHVRRPLGFVACAARTARAT